MRSELSFCLLQIRGPNDPVAAHEHDCFIRRLDVAPIQVAPLDVFTVPLDESIYERFDAVLVGGSGEYSVLDDVPPIRRLLDFLGETAERRFPTFGSCFGFQALSMALGGAVVHDPARAEVGTFDVELGPEGIRDPLFGTLSPRFLAQQGHKDHVARLPEVAVRLATNQRSPNQAARFGEGLVWGTQFHPELTEEDNRQRVMRYHERYVDEIQAVLDSLQPSHETHGLLARFADTLAADASGHHAIDANSESLGHSATDVQE